MLRASRRTVLRGALVGTGGLAAAALIGCDDDDDDDDAAGTATAAPTGTGTATGTATATAEPEEPDYVTNARAEKAPFAYNWPEPETAPVKGGTFLFGASFTHASFDNITSGGGSTQTTNTLVGDMLVGYHHGPDMSTYEIELDADFGLARSWEIAPDGLSITFDLREANYQNVEPINGRPLVAQDVALAYERMLNGRQAGLLRGLGSVEAVDDRTVRFNMDVPNADILIAAGNRETPIYAPEMYDQGIQDTTPLGTGAAILDPSRTVQDQVMAFVANPDYWGGAPLLDGIDVLTIQDPATRTATFRAGQNHHGLPTLRNDELDALWDTLPNMNVMSNPPLMGIGIFAVHSQKPPFDDERVRRAVKMGIDTDRYLAIRFPDTPGYPGSLPGFGWPFLFDSNPGRAAFTSAKYGELTFNPAESMKLLAAAGVQPGLQIKHRTPGGFTAPGAETELIYEDLREIGIEVEQLAHDGQAFSFQYYSRGWADPATADSEMIQGWSTASPTANGYFFENVHSQSATEHFGVSDPIVDDLADRQVGEFDPAARRELHLQILDRYNEQAYWLDNIPASAGTFIVRPEVRFWRFHGPYIGIHSFWDWGYGFHKGWLDPNPPADTLTIDLRA